MIKFAYSERQKYIIICITLILFGIIMIVYCTPTTHIVLEDKYYSYDENICLNTKIHFDVTHNLLSQSYYVKGSVEIQGYPFIIDGKISNTFTYNTKNNILESFLELNNYSEKSICLYPQQTISGYQIQFVIPAIKLFPDNDNLIVEDLFGFIVITDHIRNTVITFEEIQR